MHSNKYVGHLVECRRKDQEKKKERQDDQYAISPEVKKGYNLSANAYKKDANKIFTKSHK